MVYSGLVVNSRDVVFIAHRKICRFDYFKGSKFGSLRNLNIIAFKSATKLYTIR